MSQCIIICSNSSEFLEPTYNTKVTVVMKEWDYTHTHACAHNKHTKFSTCMLNGLKVPMGCSLNLLSS